MSEAKEPEGVWCVVANVIEKPRVKADGTVHRGLKAFSPGTKVYCFPPAWGDGWERMYVLGRHRGSPRLTKVIVGRKWLTNMRVKYVRDPRVVQFGPDWSVRERAESIVEVMRLRDLARETFRAGVDRLTPTEALFHAASTYQEARVEEALARGADVGFVRDDGWTALGLAFFYNRGRMVELLLERGADPSRMHRLAIYSARSWHREPRWQALAAQAEPIDPAPPPSPSPDDADPET